MLACVDRIEHDESRIVDPGIRIFETDAVLRLERRTGRVSAQIDRARGGETLAAREVIVEEKSRADHPRGPQVPVVRHHETQRPDDVRCEREQHLALLQRLADEAEIVELEVAQTAVDQFRAGRRRVRGEIVLLDEQHAEITPGGITRDARTVDTAACFVSQRVVSKLE